MNRPLVGTLALLFAVGASAADVEKFYDPESDYPFSSAVRVGDILFLSGQIGDANDALVEGGIVPEARQTMTNIQNVIESHGLTMNDVVKCTVFLADISEWGTFNEVYVEFFDKPYPARSALGASGLALGARTEVECIAAFPD